MALDHYVSQVYLRQFLSPALGGRKLHGFNKRTQVSFICATKDICRIDENSTNSFLANARIIEEFLEFIEPNYNKALNGFRADTLLPDDVFVVSGFVAYVMTCSPTGMRLHAETLRHLVESEAEILDKTGDLPKPPPELGEGTLTDLIKSGMIEVKIDKKYPQAIGISQILTLTQTFGNSDWDILINSENDMPLITSDYPVLIEQSADIRVLNKIVPLAPDIAIRIRPTLDVARSAGLNCANFRMRRINLKRSEVSAINALTVRCADRHVFYRDDSESIRRFFNKHAPFLIQSETMKIKVENGLINWSTTHIRPV